METKVMEKYGVYLLYDLVDNSIMVQLQAMSQRWRSDKWQVGDLANELNSFVAQNHYPVTDEEVYRFVAIMLNHEIAARTVRHYASLSSYFPAELRHKYLDLPHSHFAFARSYGDKAIDILALSQAQCDLEGKPPSVEWLYGAVQYVPIQDAGEYINQAAQLEPEQLGDLTPFVQYLGNFCQIIDKFTTMIERVVMPAAIRSSLYELLDKLKETLAQLRERDGEG